MRLIAVVVHVILISITGMHIVIIIIVVMFDKIGFLWTEH